MFLIYLGFKIFLILSHSFYFFLLNFLELLLLHCELPRLLSDSHFFSIFHVFVFLSHVLLDFLNFVSQP